MMMILNIRENEFRSRYALLFLKRYSLFLFRTHNRLQSEQKEREPSDEAPMAAFILDIFNNKAQSSNSVTRATFSSGIMARNSSASCLYNSCTNYLV